MGQSYSATTSLQHIKHRSNWKMMRFVLLLALLPIAMGGLDDPEVCEDRWTGRNACKKSDCGSYAQACKKTCGLCHDEITCEDTYPLEFCKWKNGCKRYSNGCRKFCGLCGERAPDCRDEMQQHECAYRKGWYCRENNLNESNPCKRTCNIC